MGGGSFGTGARPGGSNVEDGKRKRNTNEESLPLLRVGETQSPANPQGKNKEVK